MNELDELESVLDELESESLDELESDVLEGGGSVCWALVRSLRR